MYACATVVKLHTAEISNWLFLVLGIVAWESNLHVSVCNNLQQSNITMASQTAGAAAANGEMSKDALHIGP